MRVSAADSASPAHARSLPAWSYRALLWPGTCVHAAPGGVHSRPARAVRCACVCGSATAAARAARRRSSTRARRHARSRWAAGRGGTPGARRCVLSGAGLLRFPGVLDALGYEAVQREERGAWRAEVLALNCVALQGLTMRRAVAAHLVGSHRQTRAAQAAPKAASVHWSAGRLWLRHYVERAAGQAGAVRTCGSHVADGRELLGAGGDERAAALARAASSGR